MATTIDRKVVEMQFDNQKFEDNVSTSISTIEKLKKSLNMDSAVEGFNKLDQAAGKLNLSGIVSAAETVKTSFSALEVMGITALMRITNQAISTGERLVKSLSIDNIAAGWNKYNQMNASVQTLVNSTGKSVEEIDGYLERLMWYSDETSYSFTDMTSALSQMTSSGGDIDKLIPMITGIANATAFAGKGASEFSSTIRNLGQSYQTGYLNLMDMKSLNLMGTSSKQLKETFIAVGEEMGKIAKGSVTIQNFDNTLSKKWADKSVMEEALSRFSALSEAAYQAVQNGEYDTAAEAIEALAGQYDNLAVRAFKSAQEAKTFTEAIDATKDAVSSGWLQTFKIIFGNYDEAKVLWTDLANALWDVFASGAEARNEILQTWKELGGRDDLVNAFWDMWYSIDDIFQYMKDAWHSIFPEKEIEEKANALKKITGAVSDIAEKLRQFTSPVGFLTDKLSEIASNNIVSAVADIAGVTENTAKNLFELGTASDFAGEEFLKTLNWVTDGSETMQSKITRMLKAAASDSDQVYDVLSEMLGVTPEIVMQLHDIGIEFGYDSKQFQGFISAWGTASPKIKELVTNILKLTDGNKTIENLKKTFRGLAAVVDIVKQAFTAAFQAIKPVFSIFGDIGNGILGATGSLGDWLVALDESIRENETFTNTASKVANVLQTIIDNLKKLFGYISSNASPIIESVKSFLKDFADKLISVDTTVDEMGHTITSTVNQVGESISSSPLVEFLQTLWNIAKKVFSVLGSLFTQLGSAIVDLLSGGNFDKVSEILGAVSGAFSSIMLAYTSWNLTSFVDTVGEFHWVLESMAKNLNSKRLVNIAIAIGVLAASLFVVSRINPERLSGAVGAITVLAADLALSMKYLSGIKGGVKGMMSMVALAASVFILASAVKKIGDLNPEQLIGSVIAVTFLTAMMAKVAEELGSQKLNGTKGAGQLIALAASVYILALAIKKISDLNPEQMLFSVVAIGALLAVLSTVINNTNANGLKSVRAATGIIAIAVAINLLAVAMRIIGSMDPTAMGQGLLAITLSLAVISAFVNLMPKNLVFIASGLLIASGALLVIAGVLKILGTMDVDTAGTSLMILAGAMTILAIGLNAMKGTLAASAALLVASSALIVMSGALMLLGGMSIEQIAKSLGVLAGTFIIMGVAAAVLKTSVTSIIALSKALAIFGLSVLAIGAGLALAGIGLTSIAASLTAVATSVVASISIILAGIGGLIPAFISLVSDIVLAIMKTIGDNASAFADMIKKVVLAVVDILVESAPQLVDGLLKFVIALLDSLNTYLPTIVEKIVELLANLFSSVIDAFSKIDIETFGKALAGVGILVGIIAAIIAIGPLIPKAMADILGLGILIGELALVLAAIGALSLIPGLEWLVNKSGDFLESIGVMIGKFIGGILGGIAEGATSRLGVIGQNLTDFITNATPFIEGVSSLNSDSFNGLQALADAILMLSGASFLDAVASWLTGEDSFASFGNSLKTFGTALLEYSNIVVDVNAEVIQKVADVTKYLAEIGKDIKTSAGDNLAYFGNKLKLLGASFSEYNENVKNISANNLDAILNSFKSLVEFASTAGSYDISGMSTIMTELNSVFSSSLTTIVNDAGTIFEEQYKQFITYGQMLLINLISGIKLKEPYVKSAFSTMVAGIITYIRDRYLDFYNSGKYLVEGFAEGIADYTWYAIEKTTLLGEKAARALNEALDINSPSRVAVASGRYFGMGFVNGITEYADKSYEAGSEVADSAREGMNEAIKGIVDFINTDMDTQPTIRPVLDLSEVQMGAHNLSALLSTDQAVQINTNMRQNSEVSNQNGDADLSKTGNNISFVQNNYSPKSLSRIEIYRQTKNQFSTLKGLMES